MKLIGRIVCRFKGHRRGKLVTKGQEKAVYRCPRCGRDKFYKIKPSERARA